MCYVESLEYGDWAFVKNGMDDLEYEMKLGCVMSWRGGAGGSKGGGVCGRVSWASVFLWRTNAGEEVA